MKTIKTTLLVVGTLVALYLLFDFATGSYEAYQDSASSEETFSSDLVLNVKLDSLTQVYRGKTVTINSWDEASVQYLEVPVWQVYKKNKVGTLRNGDKVTLLEINTDQPEGKSAKIKTKDGYAGYITYWYIQEFESAKKSDPLL